MSDKWAHYWANKYRWVTLKYNDIDMEDLIQAARLGMFLAKQRYNPGNMSLDSYSVFYIRREIRNLIGIRNGQLPPTILSLDEPIPGTEDITRGDALQDQTTPDLDEIASQEERRQGVRDSINRLNEPFREVMTQAYLERKSHAEIAEKMGVSVVKVQHLTEQGRKKMQRDRELRRLLGLKPNGYIHIGLTRFRSTQTSAVEEAFFRLEEERERLLKRIYVEKEQDAYEEHCKYEDKVI